MKKLLFSFQIFILVLCSCQKKPVEVATIKTSDYKKAESFLYRQNDSAFYYFNKVVTTSKDSLQIAWAYNNIAVIQSDAGDYFGSQESLSQSLKLLDEQKKEHRSCLAADYNELGLASLNLKNFDAAVPYYDAAIKFSDRRDRQIIILNNKALAYQKKGAYRKALKIYTTVLAETSKGGQEYARILSNIARTKWLQQPQYNAAPELLTALRIRLDSSDVWGQNASYSHLADYYSSKKPDSALLYAAKMYKVATMLNSPDDRIEALQKLISLSHPTAVKEYFQRYQRLSDSLQTARNAAKNQFALIRYEAQKSKEENLKLQKDNAEKKYRIIVQSAMLYGIIVFMIAGAVIAVYWYRRRKQRIEAETQTAIRESQLQTSKKVHDVVANGLYRIMAEIEHHESLDRELLLDRIDLLYEQSRDISYEKAEPGIYDFHQKLSGLITSFANEETKVLIAGNSKQLWKDVDEHTKYELEHILQELMVNMKKHSHARMVVVRFGQKGSDLIINYKDDGIGLPSDFNFGNGLTNTGNRIKELNGSISFESNQGKGLKISISLPLA